MLVDDGLNLSDEAECRQTIDRELHDASEDCRGEVLRLIEALAVFDVGNQPFFRNFDHGKMNFWWTTTFAEKNFINTPNLGYLAKFVALDRALRRECQSVLFLNSALQQKLFGRTFGASMQGGIVSFKWSKIFGIYIAAFTRLISAIRFLITTIIRLRAWRVRVCSRQSLDRDKATSEIVLFSYLDRVVPTKSPVGFVSPHWVNIEKVLQENIKANKIRIVHLTWRVRSLDYAETIVNKCNEQTTSENVSHELLEASLSVSDALVSVGIFLRIYLRNFLQIPKIAKYFEASIQEHFLFACLQREFENSLFGGSLLAPIIWHQLFEKFAHGLVNTKAIFFQQENLAWEKSLVAVAHSAQVRTIGVALDPIFYWDLRYTNHPATSEAKAHFEPDLCLVNGDWAMERLNSGNFFKTEFKLVEALRYEALFDCRGTTPNAPLNSVLVVGSISTSETTSLIQAILESRHHKTTSVTYRPHPGCQMPLPPNLTVSKQLQIRRDFERHQIVVVAINTSAALDAYLVAKQPLFFLPASGFNFGPLFGLNAATFSSAESLDLLLQDKRLDRSERVKMNEVFCYDPDYPKWKSIMRGLTLGET